MWKSKGKPNSNSIQGEREIKDIGNRAYRFTRIASVFCVF
jgi:hypothetical protein